MLCFARAVPVGPAMNLYADPNSLCGRSKTRAHPSAFGIPGTHNIELYDALARSGQVTAVLVTDEQSAGFMADGVSRSSESVGVVRLSCRAPA